MTLPLSATAEHEADLVARALRRDEAALRTMIQSNNRRLYRVIRGVLGTADEAEDVLQDVYLKAFAALGSFRGQSSLSTWLTRIAVNEALGRLRRRGGADAVVDPHVLPFPKLADPQPDPERTMAQNEIVRFLEDAIERLPRDYRVVLIARAIEGMSTEETADMLDLNPDTVKTRLFRARALLKDEISRRIDDVNLDTFPFAGARCASLTDRIVQRMLRD